MTNLSYLSDGWLELESDPGLFTLLIEDFGCKNVQVEEIYDLSKVNLIDDHVYGFIFLFKWTEERRSRQRQMFINQNISNSNKNQRSSINNNSSNNDCSSNQEPYYVEDENLVNSMFFAHQIVPNSCATHAILSVLLNCNQIDLGNNLNRLKEMTNCMDPESKGISIGNMPELARAHNLHASETDTQEKRNKQTQTKTNATFPRTSSGDSFHFISFVNINSRVFELDGLKKFPIDHGQVRENETFAEKFRQIILERIPQQQQKENKLNLQLRKLQTDMNTTVNEDIRYSLMAVVPDRRKENSKRLKLLKSKRLMLLDILEDIIKPIKLPEPYETHNYSKFSATIDKNEELEMNVNKFTVKDLNHQMNSKMTKELNSSCSISNEQENYSDSTDTCSECETTRLSDEESCDEEDARINSLYAFKFINNNNLNDDKDEDDKTDQTTATTAVKQIDLDNFKTFTKSELIDFYRDYGLKDLLNILKCIEQEISNCEHNIKEETEKRNKFYVDDSRRTHNYNDFITTYLLMITEQKKLHEFIDTKAPVSSSTNSAVNSNKSQQQHPAIDMDSEEVPLQFFKEILTNYEDVLMKDEEDLIEKQDQNEINISSLRSLNGTQLSNSRSSNNTSLSNSLNNNSVSQLNESGQENNGQSKRTRRTSNLNSNNNYSRTTLRKSKEKVK